MMTPVDLKYSREERARFTPFLDRLAAIFCEMDASYDQTAGKYGFVCTGCMDNCCRTRFYHHTLIEYFYLSKGMESLDPTDRKAIHSRAAAVNSQWRMLSSPAPVTMCPLNTAGRCRLYAYRPMICRLHGIPHELNHPVKGRSMGPGCHEFVVQCGMKPYISFDRTPHYRKLADLEKSFRQETGLTIKMKMTVAEMLANDTEF